MAPGTGNKFGAPRSKLRSFESKFTVMKKVLVTLLGRFGAPAVIWLPLSDSAPGNCDTLALPIVTPLLGVPSVGV